MVRYSEGGMLTAIAVILALFLHSAGAQTSEGSTRNPYSYGHVTPSMIILLVIFIFVVFLMLVFAIYIRHCSSAARGTITPSDIGIRITGLRGLDPAILNTFPTFSYSEVKLHKIGKGALECAVCLTEFADEETLRFLPKCDHVFHHDCIDLWLASHSTCPVCRANLDQLGVEAAQSIENTSEQLPNGLNRDEPITDIPEVPQSFDVTNAEKPLMMKDGFISFSMFPKSHSTGHCLVQPGENMDRFTLRLPVEIRNQLMNRTLARSTSVVVLPTVNSWKKWYKDEGNGNGNGNGGSMDRITEERWWWSGLLVRNDSSIKPGFGAEGTSWIMGLVRQLSRKGSGSRKDGSGSTRDKSIRPEV